MREFLLYCAGPITGESYAGCTGWRDHVAQKMPPHIHAVSPMRAKVYLAAEPAINHSYEWSALSCAKGITARDRYDVMRADMVLVNLLGARQISIGSVMEIAWADAWRKPVVIAMEKGNIHEHPILRESAGFIVSTLDEAITIAIAVLSPEI